MARRRSEIKELQDRLRALAPNDQAEVVKTVMTPAMQLRLTLEKLWSRPGNRNPRAAAKVLRTAQREARRERAQRRQSRT